MTLTAVWKDASGVTHTVTSVQQDGETDADFLARHNAAVAAQVAQYPPAGG